jgi:hypothetical protein
MSITTNVANSNPAHAIQHYVITFASDLRQVGGFLRFPPADLIITLKIKLFSTWYRWKIAELLNNSHSLTRDKTYAQKVLPFRQSSKNTLTYVDHNQPSLIFFFFKLFILFMWNIHYLQNILFLCIFLRFWCLILELFWQCGTLFFILSIIVGVVVLRLLDLQLLCNQCFLDFNFDYFMGLFELVVCKW